MGYDGVAERGYAALCKRYGIAPDLFDAKAHWDSSLGYRENINHLEEEVRKIAPEQEPTQSAKQVALDSKRRATEIYIRTQQEKQQYLDTLFNGAKERVGVAEEILDEVRKFNPHSERITLSTLLAINQGMNVINLSPAGYGKSRGTKELLEVLGIPYTEIMGHKAPTDFFEELKNAKGLVLIDESATLLRNNDILNLLLSALWTHKISWRDDTANVEANIVFNTNSLPKTPFMEALKDRCQFNQLRLDTRRIKEKLRSDFDYKPNKEIWEKVRNNVFVKTELTPEEIEKMKETLEVMNPKSVRDKGRLLGQARFAKALFGSVDYVRLFVDLDAVASIMGSELKRAEKVKAIAEIEGVNETTARRWLAKEEM